MREPHPPQPKRKRKPPLDRVVLEAIQRKQEAVEQSRQLLALPVYPFLPSSRPGKDEKR